MIVEHSTTTISFNGNFLEANVINIGLLLYGLIYILKNFLGSALLSRKEKVIAAIQESEERLKQAKNRLAEAEKQLAQTQIIIEQIRKEAKITAQKVRESILNQGKFDIDKLTESGKASIKNAEQQIKRQIQQQITNLVISRVTTQIKSEMNSDMQQSIINNNITQLKSTL